MVEQDPVARIHAIRLTVVHRDPIAVELRDTVRRARVERCRLALGRLDDLAVQLGRGRLVEPHMLFKAARPDRIEEAQRAEAVDVPSVLGHLERHLDVRLRAEVVHLGRLHLRDDVHQVGAVAQVAIVQLEFVRPCCGTIGISVKSARAGRTLVLIFVEMMQAACVEAGGTADDAMDLVSFREQEFSPVNVISLWIATYIAQCLVND